MRKSEFLQLLREALNGDVPPGVIEENIRYYDGYITDEVRKGRSEKEVIAEIGDPRLIARTIEDTTEGEDVYEEAHSYGGNSGTQSVYGERADSRNTEETIHHADLSKWYWKLAAAAVIFLVLYLVFAIVGGIFTLLAPLLGPVLCIWMIVYIVQRFRQR